MSEFDDFKKQYGDAGFVMLMALMKDDIDGDKGRYIREEENGFVFAQMTLGNDLLERGLSYKEADFLVKQYKACLDESATANGLHCYKKSAASIGERLRHEMLKEEGNAH